VTRWGVLADIHGNLPALQRALAGFKERGVERIAVLGDNLGQGDSDGCVALIEQIADVSVVGNRDLDWQARVGPSSAAYVLGLPRVAQVDGLAFSHGDARLTRHLSSNDIRDGFRRARAWLAANGCRTWLFGHTHRARIWTLGDPTEPPCLHFDAAADPLPSVFRLDDLGMEPNVFHIVNAGSVGLPFPGKGPASATVYDTATATVEIFPL
jgi:predicted phosphodiesterase